MKKSLKNRDEQLNIFDLVNQDQVSPVNQQSLNPNQPEDLALFNQDEDEHYENNVQISAKERRAILKILNKNKYNNLFWAPATSTKITNSIYERTLQHDYLNGIISAFSGFVSTLDTTPEVIHQWLVQYQDQINLNEFNQIITSGQYELLFNLDYLQPIVNYISLPQLSALYRNNYTNNYRFYLNNAANYSHLINDDDRRSFQYYIDKALNTKEFNYDAPYRHGFKIQIFNKEHQINNFLYLENGYFKWLNWELIFYLLKHRLVDPNLILQNDQINFQTEAQIIDNLKNHYQTNQSFSLKDWYCQIAALLAPRKAYRLQNLNQQIIFIYHNLMKNCEVLNYHFSTNPHNYFYLSQAVFDLINDRKALFDPNPNPLSTTNFEYHLKNYPNLDDPELICRDWLALNDYDPQIHIPLYQLSLKIAHQINQPYHHYQNHDAHHHYLIPVPIVLNMFYRNDVEKTKIHRQAAKMQPHFLWKQIVAKLLNNNYLTLPKQVVYHNQIHHLSARLNPPNQIPITFEQSSDPAQQQIINYLSKPPQDEPDPHLLCDSPAGVGKTQTLVNALINNFYLDKYVLVVTAKSPALKIIKTRFYQSLMDLIGDFVKTFVNPLEEDHENFKTWLELNYQNNLLENPQHYWLFLKLTEFTKANGVLDWNYIYSIDYRRPQDQDYQLLIKSLEKFISTTQDKINFCAFSNFKDHQKMFNPNHNFYYDLIIFDEASQLDINQARLLFKFTKQMAVFGDVNQLKPERSMLDLQWAYQANEPLLDLLTWATQQSNWTSYRLNTSYRCQNHHLLKWSNQHIYDNQLLSIDQNLPSHILLNQGVNYHEIAGHYKDQANQAQIDFGIQWTIDLIWFNLMHNQPIDIMHLCLQSEHARQLKARFKQIVESNPEISQETLSNLIQVWSNPDLPHRNYFEKYLDPQALEAMLTCFDQINFNDINPQYLRHFKLFQLLIKTLVDPNLAIQFKTIETMQGAEANDVLCHGVYSQFANGSFPTQYKIFSTEQDLNAINVVMSRAKKSFTLLNSLDLPAFKAHLQQQENPQDNQNFYRWIKAIKSQASHRNNANNNPQNYLIDHHSPHLSQIQTVFKDQNLVAKQIGRFGLDALKIKADGQIEYAVKINDVSPDQNELINEIKALDNLLKARDYHVFLIKPEQLDWFNALEDLKKTHQVFKKISAKQKAAAGIVAKEAINHG